MTDRIKEALDQFVANTTCNCDPCYKDRELHEPNADCYDNELAIAAQSDYAAMRASHAECVAKLRKIARWQGQQALRCQEAAKASRFETMKEAYLADERNHRLTMLDIEKTLTNAAKLRGESI